MSRISLLLAFLSVLLSASAFAEDSRRVTVSLQTGAPVAAGVNSAEPVATSNQRDELVAATVVAVEPLAERSPRVRRIDYSPDQIVLIGLAADGSELTRSVMIDPRLVRAEAFRGEDDLSSTRLYRRSVDFSFAVDDPDVVHVRIMKPRWNGNSWQFELLTEAPLQ